MDPQHRKHEADAKSHSGRKDPDGVLWSAILADRRSRDDRTARLRAMRLASGER